MDSVKSVVQRLLPNGTGPRRSYQRPPAWPPDLFAVAATLVNLSGCYARTVYQCGLDGCFFDEAYRARVKDVGERFGRTETPPPEVKSAWTRLMNSGGRIVAGPDEHLDWWDDAMFLLAVADEACVGVGFAHLDSRVARAVLRAYLIHKTNELGESTTKSLLPYIPNSLCREVPPHEACVQPKTRTPQIGCTLRSLTHNIALLPPIGEVKTQWDYAISHLDNSDEPLNMLLVPFPYRIRGTSFAARPTEEAPDSPRAAFFDLNQTWLDDVKSSDIVTFIQDLIREAEREVARVHAVVLPEAALTRDMAAAVAETLGKESKIELFVSGAILDEETGECPRNLTYSAVFKQGNIVGTWTQSKHHRWKLDEGQVRRYHLGHVLGKKNAWWERINVADRECHFYVFRYGASLAVLVCEDLARIDPVQSVVRAIGPNLVIALLMDGAQLERRWPGRYATVLADDPGSAVLTLTSVGLIRRSNMPSERGPRYIGLWKESLGTATELELPDGAHSLLLTISPSMEENVTADGRSDDKMTMKLSLTSIIGLRHGNPPPWLSLV